MAVAYEQTAGSGQKSAGAANSIKYTRTWKVVKSTRNESYNVPALIGVDIGSPWPGGGKIYCTDLTDQPDGDSLMVRVITATYASPANVAGGGGGGGGKGGGGSSARQPGRDIGLAPDQRPMVITIDSSYEMVSRPNWNDKPLAGNSSVLAMQPTGELVTGVQRPSSMVTITVGFYTNDLSPANEDQVDYVGLVNDADFTLGGRKFPARTLLLKGVSSRPCTEEWGGQTFEGTNWTYTFVYRTNYQWVLTDLGADGVAVSDEQLYINIGWDDAVPLRGLNCLQEQSALFPIDPFALTLHRDEEGIVFGDAQAAPPAVGAGEGPIRIVVNGVEKSAYWGGTKFVDLWGLQLQAGQTVEGTIAKAMTTSPTSEGGFAQSPSSEPIPLNPDGTPRARWAPVGGATPGDADYLFRGKLAHANAAVLSYRRGIYYSADFDQLPFR